MSRTKNTRKTRPPAPAGRQEMPHPRTTSRPLPRFTIFWAFLIAAVLMLIGIPLWQRHVRLQQKNAELAARRQETDRILLELSHSDLSKLEPQVVRKMQDLTEAVRQNPDSSEAWGKLAMTYDIHGRELESIPCYRQAAQLNPSEFRWLYYCAIALQQSGSGGEEEWYERSLKLYPNYPPAHIRLGQSYLDSGNPEKAASHFRTAQGLDPENSHAYYGLAQIAVLHGQLQDAKTDLDDAIRKNPKHGEAHGLLAEVYRRMNLKENADHELMIAQQLLLAEKTPMDDPALAALYNEGVSSHMHHLRALASIKRGDFQSAEREMQLAVEISQEPLYLDTLGYVFQRLGRYADAIPLHKKALEKDPGNPTILYNLADAYMATGNPQEAYLLLKRIRELKPEDGTSYTESAKYYLRGGKAEDAIAVLREGRRRAPGDVRILAVLGWLLSTTKDGALRNGAEALQIGEILRSRFGNNDFGTLKVLAAAYAETGQFAKAEQAAQQAYQLVSRTDPALASEIQKQLRFYQAHQPYRQ